MMGALKYIYTLDRIYLIVLNACTQFDKINELVTDEQIEAIVSQHVFNPILMNSFRNLVRIDCHKQYNAGWIF